LPVDDRRASVATRVAKDLSTAVSSAVHEQRHSERLSGEIVARFHHCGCWGEHGWQASQCGDFSFISCWVAIVVDRFEPLVTEVSGRVADVGEHSLYDLRIRSETSCHLEVLTGVSITS